MRVGGYWNPHGRCWISRLENSCGPSVTTTIVFQRVHSFCVGLLTIFCSFLSVPLDWLFYLSPPKYSLRISRTVWNSCRKRTRKKRSEKSRSSTWGHSRNSPKTCNSARLVKKAERCWHYGHAVFVNNHDVLPSRCKSLCVNFYFLKRRTQCWEKKGHLIPRLLTVWLSLFLGRLRKLGLDVLVKDIGNIPP